MQLSSSCVYLHAQQQSVLPPLFSLIRRFLQQFVKHFAFVLVDHKLDLILIQVLLILELLPYLFVVDFEMH